MEDQLRRWKNSYAKVGTCVFHHVQLVKFSPLMGWIWGVHQEPCINLFNYIVRKLPCSPLAQTMTCLVPLAITIL